MRYLNARLDAGEDRRTYKETDSTVTTNQTVFNVNYTNGRVAAFLNGVRLVPEDDYTRSTSGNGTSITLQSEIGSNNVLEVVGLNSTSSNEYYLTPSQSGNAGKFLKTDGSALSWDTVDALPDQSGHGGQYLKTDGTNSDWAALNLNSVTGAFTVTDEIVHKIQDGIGQVANSFTGTHEVSSGYNAVLCGPITLGSSATLTVNGNLTIV